MERLVQKLVVLILFGAILTNTGCKSDAPAADTIVLWQGYNDSLDIVKNLDHENPRMRYKLIESRFLDKNEVFRLLYQEVQKMDSVTYRNLAPLILEKSIPEIQARIREGALSYEDLSRFFLYRIYRYELDTATTLNTIIALNPNLIEDAKARDKRFNENPEESLHPIFGMPVLLKDNINTAGMPTTAGSAALMKNQTDNAFIVNQLQEKGAIILGKVNLSEWAYYLCKGCPVGYSAIGGQTLNPYGRKIFETGGSSSGSGTSVAANYAVAAVGTETSGSILSPSSQNSVVGLKPTIGLLSRSGIVPISSTLDTPGPMTKNVIDNKILLTAMAGKDPDDPMSVKNSLTDDLEALQNATLKGKRFGAIEGLRDRSPIYDSIVTVMERAGATIINFSPPEVDMTGFLSILNIDMKNDLPKYLKAYVKNRDGVKIQSLEDAVAFNAGDSLNRIPYGQQIFEGILLDSTTAEGLAIIKDKLEREGQRYFMEAMEKHNLHAILSINNYHAGYAAIAKFPALTIPMGYKSNGEPISLTFIGRQFKEDELYSYGYAYEKLTGARQLPEQYK